MSMTPAVRRRSLLWPLACLGAGGCAAPPPAPAPPRVNAEPAPLLVANSAIGWDEVRARLAEIGGAQAVEELVLEHQLREQLALNGLALQPADVERERALFEQTLRRASPPGEEPAVSQALMRVRRARGLGPERFEALLRRSAMLRMLVASTVRISEEDVRASLEVRYGPRVRCSIIVVSAEEEARRLRLRLAEVPPAELAERFAAEARLISVDPSGARGGQIDPVSPADPTFAGAFRETLRGLTPGSVSPVVVFDRGYAVVLVEETLPGSNPPPDAEREAREDVRQRSERIEMDRLAARLLNSAPVTVFDPGLNWSWNNRTER